MRLIHGSKLELREKYEKTEISQILIRYLSGEFLKNSHKTYMCRLALYSCAVLFF